MICAWSPQYISRLNKTAVIVFLSASELTSSVLISRYVLFTICPANKRAPVQQIIIHREPAWLGTRTPLYHSRWNWITGKCTARSATGGPLCHFLLVANAIAFQISTLNINRTVCYQKAYCTARITKRKKGLCPIVYCTLNIFSVLCTVTFTKPLLYKILARSFINDEATVQY